MYLQHSTAQHSTSEHTQHGMDNTAQHRAPPMRSSNMPGVPHDAASAAAVFGPDEL